LQINAGGFAAQLRLRDENEMHKQEGERGPSRAERVLIDGIDEIETLLDEIIDLEIHARAILRFTPGKANAPRTREDIGSRSMTCPMSGTLHRSRAAKC
jgi:hypothetical protein